MPARIFSEIRRSNAAPSSSLRSRSTRSRCNRLRTSRDTRRIGLCLERARDRERNTAPLRLFLAELFSAGLGERVVLGAAVVFRRLPACVEPAGLFEAMERRKQRAWLDDEGAAGHLLDAARHAEAVQFAAGERFENQQVEGALQQSGALTRHRDSLLSTFYTSGRVMGFLSDV